MKGGVSKLSINSSNNINFGFNRGVGPKLREKKVPTNDGDLHRHVHGMDKLI